MDDSKDTECDKHSAPPVSVNYRLPDVRSNDESLSVDALCSKCKTTTTQEWVKITPLALFDVKDPFKEVLDKVKRLVICTNCGTLSLKL